MDNRLRKLYLLNLIIFILIVILNYLKKKKKKANNFCEKRKKMNLKLIISNLQAWQGLFATLEALIYC